MLIQLQYSIVLAASFKALSSQVEHILGSQQLKCYIVDNSTSKQNAFRLAFNLVVEILLYQRHTLQTIRRKYSKKRRYRDTQSVLLVALSLVSDVLEVQFYLDKALQSLLGSVNDLLYNYIVREQSIDFVPIQATCFRRDNLLKIGIRTTNYIEAYYSEFKSGNKTLIKKQSLLGTLSYSIDTDRKQYNRVDDVADERLQLLLFRDLGYKRLYDLLFFIQVKVKDQYRKAKANDQLLFYRAFKHYEPLYDEEILSECCCNFQLTYYLPYVYIWFDSQFDGNPITAAQIDLYIDRQFAIDEGISIYNTTTIY